MLSISIYRHTPIHQHQRPSRRQDQASDSITQPAGISTRHGQPMRASLPASSPKIDNIDRSDPASRNRYPTRPTRSRSSADAVNHITAASVTDAPSPDYKAAVFIPLIYSNNRPDKITHYTHINTQSRGVICFEFIYNSIPQLKTA